MTTHSRFALGNDEPLPGARSALLIIGGATLGYVLLTKLVGGGGRRNPEDDTSRCPLRTEMYGGLPGGGGYGSSTEYEIGAQRIAEAAHCLLGSLGNLVNARLSTRPSWEHGLFYENEHIAEEMDIISSSITEYSRPLYSNRLLPSAIHTEYARHPEMATMRLGYAQRSVTSIQAASPKLIAIAEQNLAALDPGSMPEPIWMVADRAYKFVVALAKAMERSVRRYPASIDNAFQDKRVDYRAFLLRASVDQLLEMRPKERV